MGRRLPPPCVADPRRVVQRMLLEAIRTELAGRSKSARAWSCTARARRRGRARTSSCTRASRARRARGREGAVGGHAVLQHGVKRGHRQGLGLQFEGSGDRGRSARTAARADAPQRRRCAPWCWATATIPCATSASALLVRRPDWLTTDSAERLWACRPTCSSCRASRASRSSWTPSTPPYFNHHFRLLDYVV